MSAIRFVYTEDCIHNMRKLLEDTACTITKYIKNRHPGAIGKMFIGIKRVENADGIIIFEGEWLVKEYVKETNFSFITIKSDEDFKPRNGDNSKSLPA